MVFLAIVSSFLCHALTALSTHQIFVPQDLPLSVARLRLAHLAPGYSKRIEKTVEDDKVLLHSETNRWLC